MRGGALIKKENKMEGIVKNFNNLKGYGFIKSPQVEGDIFVHFSAIKQEGYKELQPGDVVEFELEKTDKGFSAKNVILSRYKDE